MPNARTLITLATYNEIENLPRLVGDIEEQAPGVDILVIDDNSPDGTGRWCDEQSQSNEHLHCLHRPGKLGLGSATIAGMRYAIEHGYEHVLNMDADYSHHPRYLNEILARAEADDHPDVVIGSRYIRGGQIEGWPLTRHLMSRSVNIASRRLLGLPTKDCSGAFRCYRVDRLAELDFNEFRSHGYVFQEEILWRLRRNGCRFAEVPITFTDRQHGASKVDGSEIGLAIRTLLALAVDNWRR